MRDDWKEQTDELVRVCRNLYAGGLQRANGGNISVRAGDSCMAVKAKGTCFREAEAGDFVLTDLNGQKLDGEKEPTKESLMHGTIYRRQERTGAIVHVHAPYAVAWSSFHAELKRFTWPARLKFETDIPVLDIKSPVVRKEDIPMLEEILERETSPKGFILKEHGIVALGKDLKEAQQNAELIEETAKIAVLRGLAIQGREE